MTDYRQSSEYQQTVRWKQKAGKNDFDNLYFNKNILVVFVDFSIDLSIEKYLHGLIKSLWTWSLL